MSNLEKLPSGSWRFRKTINGNKISVTFDHKPTDAEIAIAVAENYSIVSKNVVKQTFEVCCRQCIAAKEHVISPGTIRTYTIYTDKTMSDSLKRMDISRIDALTIQNEVNNYAVDHAPKSVHNYHAFLSMVLKMYRPDLRLTTTLPKIPKYEAQVLTEEEVKQILIASENTKYHIPFQLGVLGLRRGEVCALTLDDVKGNELTINKSKVMDKHDNWIVKQITKTEEGMRKIYIPDSLSAEIHEQGVIYDGSPISLLHALNRLEKKLGIKNTRFHDLRVFYATYAHSLGTPDAVILANGGWRSEYTMKKVYRKAMDNDKKKYQDIFSQGLM